MGNRYTVPGISNPGVIATMESNGITASGGALLGGLKSLSNLAKLRSSSLAPAAADVAIHGNSALSPRTAYLYELYSKDGTFLKNGVTQNLNRIPGTVYLFDMTRPPA